MTGYTVVSSREAAKASSWVPGDYVGGPEPDDLLGIDTACGCGFNPSTEKRTGGRASVDETLLMLDVGAGRYVCRDENACASRMVLRP